MAHSYSYEDEEYFGDEPSFLDETLAGALDNTVQLSINKALERELGPLTVHFENFACQKGWLPPIASSEEALSDQPSTSKVFPKLKKLSVRIRTSHPPNPRQDQILSRILVPGQARVWIRVEIIRSKDVQIRMVASVSVPGILCLDVGSCFVRFDDVAIIDSY
ncbi:hypothetical protein NDU88_005878 [Pleurodeles waltl]|uniref:Uncharacterized protein n=1 Tax=Pleurodeles waltl TaxID=8319 RepID=A0AAV7UJB2_PLEWA|nr:hypothetical protein NDU88_005878 [Pleurodeles waltl]